MSIYSYLGCDRCLECCPAWASYASGQGAPLEGAQYLAAFIAWHGGHGGLSFVGENDRMQLDWKEWPEGAPEATRDRLWVLGASDPSQNDDRDQSEQERV